MTGGRNTTPLIALDADVLDTETTSLDPARARIVEVAAIRLAGGQLQPQSSFRALVRPDESIPAAATAIHGISDVTVASAGRFADVWPQLRDFLGADTVIGHTIGFDFAVLKSECERARVGWRAPRSLDTRLLAEVAEPRLADFSLDQVAAWLGVEIKERHSALADAVTTGRIFIALLPKLRDGQIRTLAQAEQACRALTKVLDEQHRAGWGEAVASPSRSDTESSLGRIDSYPYRHRIADVMSAPPQFISGKRSLEEALGQMAKLRISSLFVIPQEAQTGPPPLAEEVSIVTERDVLRALAERGRDALAMPVGQMASKPLAAVPAEAFVYRAVGRMSRLKIRHLGVTDEDERVIGALSARDLLRLRAQEALTLGDEIDQATDASGLARAWAKLPYVAAGLLSEEVAGIGVAAVISRELGALTRQAAILSEARMRADGHGEPPCRYAFAVLGSAGRGESLLAMDQDNALVFATGTPDGPEDRWFAKFAGFVADILHEAGVPYCKGGVMAHNPQWRGSPETWRSRIGHWIERSRPDDLLSVDIFFDLRSVYGEARLANEVWRNGFDMARGQVGFAKLLAEAAGKVESSVGFFGGFRTTEGRLDLKKAGLFAIVTFARALAIRHHVVERSTPGRLNGLKALGLGAERDIDALVEAQRTLLELMLHQQIEDIDWGLPPSNAVLVKRLSRDKLTRLRAAIESVRHLDDLLQNLLFKG
jgi:DNA polymerase-3 subunit epsilon/CBS domain-containing protein